MNARTKIIFFLVATCVDAFGQGADGIFTERVLPALKASCFGCHGEGQALGKLDLRSRETMLRGGSRGTALVPGDASKSPLYLAITGDGELKMPPGGPEKTLSPDVISAFRQWIDAGAPWPDAKQAAVKWSYKPEDLWAFQPLKKPAVPANGFDPSDAHNAIDAFILRKLVANGLRPTPQADRRTLIRRVTYDLTGLPPTVTEVEGFLADKSKDAYEKLVDRLLASPRYGEQWGRHWLDVVRYADTDGYSNDYERPNAWRYRDYVIRSFNQDKPYNQFVLEQIAGDEIDPGNPENLIATGFLRMGPWEHTAMSVAAVTRQQWLDDVTHNTAAAFLGLTLGCARCHDHKFDPIPTRDYYSFQAVFASTFFDQRQAPFLSVENMRGFEGEQADVAALLKWNEDRLRDLQGKVLANVARKKGLSRPDALSDDERKEAIRSAEGLSPADLERERIYRKRMEIYRRQLDRYRPLAYSIKNEKADDTFVLTNGNLKSPADKVMPAVLSAPLKYVPAAAQPIPMDASGRRLHLARWIASESNPLTARVIANRVWHYHFGKGLAGNPNNFGKMGRKPTHPELLDYLSTYLIDNGWRIKQLHRLILLSSTYQRASSHPRVEKVREADPENDLRSWFPPRRLSSEELRDSVLAISGQLNLRSGGVGSFAEINEDVATQPVLIMGTLSPVWQPSPLKAARNRRTVYLYQKRGIPDPLLETFNQPGSTDSCERRDATTVPMQAYALLNSKFAQDMALEFAANIEHGNARADDQLHEAFARINQRQPSAPELALLRQHFEKRKQRHEKIEPTAKPLRTPVTRSLIGEYTGKRFDFEEEARSETYEEYLHPSEVSPAVRALADVALVLLNSNEFLYVY